MCVSVGGDAGAGAGAGADDDDGARGPSFLEGESKEEGGMCVRTRRWRLGSPLVVSSASPCRTRGEPLGPPFHLTKRRKKGCSNGWKDVALL